MSVVIKMDMPKSCGMCECSGTSVCREWMKVDRRDIGSKRADTCPIICELPEKHGRLIDADAIDWWEGEDAEGNPVFILDKVDIDKEPTIIEAECGIVEENELEKLLCPKPIPPWDINTSELFPEELKKMMESVNPKIFDKLVEERIERYKAGESGG